MANRIKGITVEIGGDTTKLSKALEGVNKNIKNTQTQLKDVEKLLKLDPTNTELLSQKQKLLADAVTATKEKLETLKTAAEQANTALANGDISQEQYDALQREIIETEQELQNLQREAEASSTALAKLGQAGEMLEKAGDKIADVGTTLTTHVTVPIAAAGTAAVKTAADFDSAMSKVSAVSGATGDDLQALRDKAREMGAKTKFSASEAADAMNYMAMAGWKTGDMLEGIEGIMNLAAASGEDLATTSDIVTDALTAFGMTADDSAHFADVLAAASSNANTNVSMMGETFKYCAPVAGALVFSCEDTAQAIGLMANSGIKSTQAGTALRTIMNTLAGDVKICGDSIGEVEIATTNADGSMRDLNDILADCRSAFSQLSESEQASAAQALVGKNAMSGFLALMNAAPGDIDKLQNAIATCSDEVDGYNGVTEKMAAVMQDNLAGQLTILKSQLQELAISFGEILMPAIRSIVSRIQGLIDKFNALSPATKETIVKIALVAAALGPLLVVVGKTMVGVSKLMKFVSNLPTIIAGAKAAFTSFGAVIGGISAPVVAVIAVVAALVAAFVHLWRTNEDFRNKITAIWEQIKSIFSGFCQGIVDRINALGFDFKNITEVIKAVWDGLCKFLKPIFEGQFQQIANTFKAVTDIILSILDIFVGIFTGDWSRVWDGIKGIFAAVWNFIKDTLKNALNMICGIFGTDLGEVKEFWVNVWTSIKNFFVNIWNGIKNFVSTVLNAIKNFFTTIWTGIKNFFVGIWTAIYNDVSAKINLIKTIITVVWNAIHTAISTVLNAIWSVITTVWQTIYDFISPLLEAFRYLFETIFEAIHVIISRVMDWIHEKITTAWENIKAVVTIVLEAIKSVIETVWNAIHTAITTAMDAISNVISTVWNAISGVVNTIWSVISSIWNSIKDHITNTLNAIHAVVSAVWNAISGFISGVLNTISSVVSSIWNGIKNTVTNILNTIKTTVSNIWDSVKNAVTQKITAIKDTIVNGFNAAVNFIKNLGSQAVQWGADIINNIVSGIKSKINAVADAVKGIADKIRSFLHFSVPDEGPLADFESWMPDFMQGLAKGIDKSKKYVEAAVSGVADAMTLTMQSGLNVDMSGRGAPAGDYGAMMNGGARATVINNYNNDNSRTVNQTNNSPKSLSRLEIYRMTRNALNG
ncbi:phage tail tape measure protein [Ruminococcus champanellensis]|uniref:phage tail tape measure protein n=2 Tax=Ruminococcus TaxID=1263 RepID=UPI0020617E41|nr:phage tail tape measure protein [Ruminococcus champanellensis]MED9891318.1 phage tail tape measure protein [Ruminococcus champanellensis]DAL70422.1 MAG TPA: minor tail protein [Caudoviricetes sp.]